MIKTKYIVIVALIFIVGVGIRQLLDKNYTPDEIVIAGENTEKVLKEKFLNLEKSVNFLEEKYLSDSNNFESFFYSPENLAFAESETGYFFYHNNSLKYWSTNNIPVPVSATSGFFEKTNINLTNGWYLCSMASHDDWFIIGLARIKREYSYENDLIKSSFCKGLDLPNAVVVTNEQVEGSTRITYNDKGDSLYMFLDSSELDSKPIFTLIHFLTVSNLFVFLAFFILLLIWPARRFERYAQLLPILTAIILFVCRILMLKAGYTDSLSSFKLFSPELFAESFWLPSLGEYIINVLFLLVFAFVFFVSYKTEIKVNPSWYVKVIISISLAALMFLSGIFISGLFYGLVWNSSVSFSFENVLTLDQYSFIGVSLIVALVFSFMIVFFRLHKILIRVLSPISLVASQFVLHLIYVFFYRPDFLSLESALIFYGLFFLTWSVFSFICLRRKMNYFMSVLLVVIISLITSEHFSRLSIKKEIDAYKVITYNLAAERDVSAEFFLKEAYNEMMTDEKLAESILAKDFKSISTQINNILLSKRYFNKYEAQTTICLSSDSLLIEPDMINVDCFNFFRSQIDEEGIIIPNTNFYFLDNHNGRISYLGEISTRLSDSILINIYIEINSKIFSEGLGYPEMLLDKKLIVKKTARDYNYAKYNKGRLISSKGDFKYQFTLKPEESDTAEYSFYKRDGYIHFKYRPDDQNIIILSKPDTQYSKELVSFTYILTFLFVIFNIIWLLVNLRKGLLSDGASLKIKIQFSFITILILSLLLTGTISIYFIVQGYKQKQKEAVLDKMHSVIVELEHKVGSSGKISYEDAQYLNTLLVKFSNVFYTDINLYDLNGILISSSRTELFDKGLKGRYLDAIAYKQLILNNSGTVILEEKIDDIDYLSAYIPFRNYDNEIIAYLNLPYFARQNEFTEEISNFVIAFSNIFLALILFAVVVGIFISRQLTRPLATIQDKIKAMDIKKKAEKIVYTRNDELGGLIREYNRKVDELSESANKLAQSEREMAWREMAKQIAHEIKNPLTPMKLSVQYLERAYDLKDENWETTYRKVSKTLIEQIDILSGIASEFSNFAKMPASKKEIISLTDIIQTSVQLFENAEDVDFDVNIEIKSNGMINADKEQMLRVFNNLIKNSVQAIPDDRRGKIKITIIELDKSYIVKVEDNGSGIPENMISKIFQPNFTTKSAGMGLGLSMVKSMLISNNATIHFNTEVGVGTEFVIEIPMLNEEEM
ncbi:MAG: ATP-binding protein [Bacteroidales bacterium]|nr:ATP-binding protein [Bacteroidales bacterium]